MKWIIYVFALLFIVMGLALFFAYSRRRHNGLLLFGATYTAAAALAVVLMEWWPLVAGFAIVWIMRAMGMEPEPEQPPTEAETELPVSAQDGQSGQTKV